MGMILSLLKIRLSYINKIVKERDFPRLFVVMAFLLIILMVMSAAFWLFLKFFTFLGLQDYFAAAITVYALNLSFAVIFILSLISFAISAFNYIYQGEELDFLFTTPVCPLRIFIYRFILASIVSSWPIFVIGIPMIIALGVSASAGFLYYLMAVIFLVPFIVTASCLGSLLSLGLVKISKKVRPAYTIIFSLILIIGGIWLLIYSVVPADLEGFFNAGDLLQAQANTNKVWDLFMYWPSSLWIILYAGLLNGDAFIILNYMFGILFSVSALLLFTFAVFKGFYFKVWAGLKDNTFLANPAEKVKKKGGRIFPRFFFGKSGALLEKDIIFFVRNFGDISKFLFLIILLVFYIFIIKIMSRVEGLSASTLYVSILTFNVAVIGYFITTIALRFVFPLVSLEGKSAWVVWSLPIDLSKIFWSKFILWSVFLSAVIELLLLAVAYFFQFGPVLTFILSVIVVCMAVSITAIALGLGTIFPNFRDSNPESLSTSGAGLFATFLSLIYLSAVSAFSFFIIRSFLFEGYLWTAGVNAIIIISGILITIFLACAPRALSKHEF